MAVNSPRVDMTTGIEFNYNSAVSGQTGGGQRFTSYAQPAWVSTAVAPNIIDGLGYVTPTVIAPAGTQTLDLRAFPRADGGTAIVFAKLTAVYIVITSTTAAGTLTIGGTGAGNGNILWFGNKNDTWTICVGGPGFCGGNPVSASGITVDATNKDILLTNNSGVSITFIAVAAGDA